MLDNIRVLQRGSAVVYMRDNAPIFVLRWDVSDAFCRQLALCQREKPPYTDNAPWQYKQLKIEAYEHGVNILLQDQLVWQFPQNLLNNVLIDFIQVTRRAEEYDKREEITRDNAIMFRSPLALPFGLSNRKDIKEQTAKEAAWNTQLRKYMPISGIDSKEMLGTPSLIMDVDQLLKGGQTDKWITYKISQMNKYKSALLH